MNSKLIDKTLELILGTVVEVEGKTVHLGDLTERKSSKTFDTIEEANQAAAIARQLAKEEYLPRIIKSAPEVKELFKKDLTK